MLKPSSPPASGRLAIPITQLMLVHWLLPRSDPWASKAPTRFPWAIQLQPWPPPIQPRAALGHGLEDEEIVAHRWVTEAFEPVVRAVPKDLRGKLEPAEVFHEVLEHRWFLSERAGVDIGLLPAARSYVEDVLKHKPDEAAVLGSRIGTPTVASDPYEEDEA